MISLIKTLSQNLYTHLEASGMVDMAQKDLLKAIIEEQLKKVGFISREEFDAQSKVLQRSHQRIQALENQVQQLEQLIQSGEIVQSKRTDPSEKRTDSD